MITEVAIFTAIAGKEEALGQGILRGLKVFRQHPKCSSVHVSRCLEQPAQYMLTVTWASLEAHTIDFRSGPLFPQWRSHINGLFEPSPTVFHYQELKKE